MTKTYMRHVARAVVLSLILPLGAFAQGGPAGRRPISTSCRRSTAAVQQRRTPRVQADPGLATKLEHELGTGRRGPDVPAGAPAAREQRAACARLSAVRDRLAALEREANGTTCGKRRPRCARGNRRRPGTRRAGCRRPSVHRTPRSRTASRPRRSSTSIRAARCSSRLVRCCAAWSAASSAPRVRIGAAA